MCRMLNTRTNLPQGQQPVATGVEEDGKGQEGRKRGKKVIKELSVEEENYRGATAPKNIRILLSLVCPWKGWINYMF